MRKTDKVEIEGRFLETFSEFRDKNREENRIAIERPSPEVDRSFSIPKNFDQSFIKILACVLVLGVVCGYFYAIRSSKTSKSSMPSLENISTTTTNLDVEESSTKASKIKVYVSGAVNSPGVVEVDSKARVVDVIAQGGGALASANLQSCNLAAFVSDGSTVFVPEKDMTSSQIPIGGCGQNLTSITPGESPTVQNGINGATTAKVNLNMASQTELETLPGIGPAMATAIMSYRTKTGKFNSVNDLRKVKGIGDKKFADLKDLVST